MASGMILAAGLGTRLRPLSDQLPKPLVPLGDVPLLVRVARRLAHAAVAPLAFNTHHLAAAFEVRELADLGLRVFHEPAILGTAGGVANARAVLGDDEIVVWNGDLEADVDVRKLLDEHRHSKNAATLVVAPRLAGEGTVGLDARGNIVRLRNECFGEEAAGGDFLGAQVIGAGLIGDLPREGCLVGDVYLPALRRGESIGASVFHGEWDDIGSLAAYLRANIRWLGERTAFVGDGAEVAPNVTLEASVIGAGARVHGLGWLHRVVVWPGAIATAPLASAIVTPRGVVSVG